MPSNRTIAQIKSGLLRPALTSHFEVQIPVGTGNLNTLLKGVAGDTGLQDLLNISCSDASLPGSSIATFELQNDFTGVTERYAHRRMYDDRIDFTFYVDAERYLPIRFFEAWMRYVTGESGPRTDTSQVTLKDSRYHYRMNFPKDYRCEDGLKIIKFERDYETKLPQHGHSSLEYEFVGAYPISVSSMPVSYDASNLLKCTVSMTYLRYVIKEVAYQRTQSKPNIGSKLSPQTSTLPQPLQKSSQANQNTGSQGQQSSSTSNASTIGTPFNFTPSTNLGLGANAIPSSVQSGVT